MLVLRADMTGNEGKDSSTMEKPSNPGFELFFTFFKDQQRSDIKKIQELLALQLRVADFAIRSEPPKPVVLFSSPSEEFASSRLLDRLN